MLISVSDIAWKTAFSAGKLQLPVAILPPKKLSLIVALCPVHHLLREGQGYGNEVFRRQNRVRDGLIEPIHLQGIPKSLRDNKAGP